MMELLYHLCLEMEYTLVMVENIFMSLIVTLTPVFGNECINNYLKGQNRLQVEL